MMNAVLPAHFKIRIVPRFGTNNYRQSEVHYIGGAEVLPAPLDAQNEFQAISELGSSRDKEARELLIEHNLRLVVYIAKKFDNTGVS